MSLSALASDRFQSFKSLSCCVTGGAGFIGSHLVEALVGQGATVTVLDDLSSGDLERLSPWRASLRIVEGSILDDEALDDALEGVQLVYHHAALVSVPESLEHPERYKTVNVGGTRSVLEASVRHGVSRLIYAGSCSAYGNLPGLPKVETDPVEPTSPYAATKLEGEHLVGTYADPSGLDTARLRYFNVFGPRQPHNSPYAAVVPKFVEALSSGGSARIFGDGGQTRDFIDVRDVVQANLRAGVLIEPHQGCVYNIGSGTRVSILEVLETVARQLDLPARMTLEEARGGEVRDSEACIDLARERLGFQPERSLAESVREIANTAE